MDLFTACALCVVTGAAGFASAHGIVWWAKRQAASVLRPGYGPGLFWDGEPVDLRGLLPFGVPRCERSGGPFDWTRREILLGQRQQASAPLPVRARAMLVRLWRMIVRAPRRMRPSAEGC
jgi:hypothetical protein